MKKNYYIWKLHINPEAARTPSCPKEADLEPGYHLSSYIPKMYFWSGPELKKQEPKHREHPYTHTEGKDGDQP